MPIQGIPVVGTHSDINNEGMYGTPVFEAAPQMGLPADNGAEENAADQPPPPVNVAPVKEKVDDEDRGDRHANDKLEQKK